MCETCRALFRYILKDVRLCFSSSVYTKGNYYNLDFLTRIQLFSVQSLQERVLEFQIFTTNARMLRVEAATSFVGGIYLLYLEQYHL